VQDFPARYSPQVGFEGANVIFDTWVHPLTMGLEEHLLHMFRDDFEFNDQAAPSHLHSGEGAAAAPPHVTGSVSELLSDTVATENGSASWTADAEQELKKIPFFVRGKARRNTEAYARDAGHPSITIETLYEAKAHYAR
jgi:light-independent protochlorophyllide reductase subunit B